MVQLILKAKNWQLFLFIVLLPFLFYVATIILTLLSIAGKSGDSFSWVKTVLPWASLVVLLSTALYFAWLWSVAIGLQYKIPYNIKMKVKKFKFIYFIPFIYFLYMLSIFFLPFVAKFLHTAFVIVLFVLQIISIISIFYCIYFIAKTIRTAEVKSELTFSYFANEFFLILFFPIGIWFLQPRINKLVEDEEIALSH